MGSGNSRLDRHVPATLKLADALLRHSASDRGSLPSRLRHYEHECSSDQASLAYEFAPYLYHLLSQLKRTDLTSKKSLGLMRERAVQAASTALARRHILGKIGAALNRAGIDAILLKGAAMDRWAYPEQGFRLGSDIDLLVREADYHRIDGALAPLAEHQEKYPGRSAFNAFAVEKPFFVSSPTEVWLDVHRNLTIPHVYDLDPGELFERANPHPAEPSLLVMSPEDNLLHFAIHSFYDMRLFNKQTLDAYQLMLCTDIDWNVLERRAREYRMRGPLTYFLHGLSNAFGGAVMDIPADMVRPTQAKIWLIEKLLTASPAVLADRDISYRIRQLACQLTLSGNTAGYTRYNLAYTRARLKK